MSGGIERKPVFSSSIKSIGYESSSETLAIEFTSEAVYEFSGIPPAMYERLMQAESKGRFFGTEISRKFPYRRLDDSKRRKNHGADSKKTAQIEQAKAQVKARAQRNRPADSGDNQA